MTEATFDEMDPILGSHANVKPPLTINALSTGYTDIYSVSLQNGDTSPVIEEEDTDIEGSQRSKKKCKTRITSNELIEALKQKWEDDKEAEGVICAENQAAREKHLDLLEQNTEAACSIAESFKLMTARIN
jgi:hypothetical protein